MFRTKIITEIENFCTNIKIGLSDKVILLGSCFSENIGQKLIECGFEAKINPFGALYNPISVCDAIDRLNSGEKFEIGDCQKMGSGSELICSFNHHTSFARKTEKDFLENANALLEQSSRFWKDCNKVIISLGSAWVWKKDGKVVVNCLKRPTKEFSRELLSLEEISMLLNKTVTSYPEKDFIFTVSPIRHLGEFGAHSNTISKSLLHLGIQNALENKNTEYFPAYEIMMDELRDYRFYASDLVHPGDLGVSIIWEKFLNSFVNPDDYQKITENYKSTRLLNHKIKLER